MKVKQGKEVMSLTSPLGGFTSNAELTRECVCSWSTAVLSYVCHSSERKIPFALDTQERGS